MDWKAKLAAYLHDPPSKALNIGEHEELTRLFYTQTGFTDEEAGNFTNDADWTAAAADRFPFPQARSGLSCHFDGVRNQFHHPLGGSTIQFNGPFLTADLAQAKNQEVQPVLDATAGDEQNLWRSRFIAHWRLWPQFCIEKDYRFAFLPADTRLPDHSIWNHMAVVSALEGTVDNASLPEAKLRPAFLRFHIGGVQQFISEARTTRDLWSGSYLISWLIAAGLKELSLRVGPDSVIFPNLRNQPILDLLLREELWGKVKIGNHSIWDATLTGSKRPRFGNKTSPRNDDFPFLTPNLPNTFLAVVPASVGADLARQVETSIRSEWRKICDIVWRKVVDDGLLEVAAIDASQARSRFKVQTERFPSISWHLLPWPQTLADAEALAENLPMNHADPQTGGKSLMGKYRTVVDTATSVIPESSRDPRYYEGGADGNKKRLRSIGVAWPLLTAVSSWCIAAVRQTHPFRAARTGGWQETGSQQSKDALNGRDEMIVGGPGFSEVVSSLESEWRGLFKHDDPVGALTLVKRTWHWAYLAEQLHLKCRPRGDQFPMPDTRSVANHEYDSENSESILDDAESETAIRGTGSYFAVLALDGDKMGKWVNGDKAPSFASQFARYKDGNGNPVGAGPWFESVPGTGEFLKTARLVSPSYHLQFSEALSNFALNCAGPIVEAFYGRLIYAGGDDVLALVPSDTALACARALRCAFQGKPVLGPDGSEIFKSHGQKGGFLSSPNYIDQQGHPIPFVVPGPNADCSVGIAIAHFKSPLQDVVREAQHAEKRAKSDLERSAVAVTLLKRSGEILHWGSNWDSGGLELFDSVLRALNRDVLSAKFPHRIVELVKPYSSDSLNRNGGTTTSACFREVAHEVLLREIAVAAERQRGRNYKAKCEEVDSILELARKYLGNLKSAEEKVSHLIGLCETVAFARRTSDFQYA